MPILIDVATKKAQAQALKNRGEQGAALAKAQAETLASAAQDGDTAAMLYDFAEKMAGNAGDGDDEFVNPMISKADALLTRGLAASPEAPPTA